MDNNITTKTKDTEPDESQIPLRWGQRSTWIVVPSFLFLGLSLSSTLTLAQKFSDELFVVNWLPWFAAVFFTIGWLLTHWLEVVAFQRQKRNTRLLVLVIGLASLFFFLYLGLLVNHEVLSRFGMASIGLIWSGCGFRLSIFRDESYVFLQKNNWLRQQG